MYVSSSNPFFANCCSYLHACNEQFKLDYLNFDNNFSNYLKKRFKLKRNYVPSLIETFESQLIDLVRFHIKMKEYANFYKSVGLELCNEILKRKLHFRVFDDVAESNTGTLFFQLFGNVIYFACILFQLEQDNYFIRFLFVFVTCFQSIYDPDLRLFFDIFGCVISLSTSAVLCYSGSRGIQTLISCGEVAFNVGWYTYPVTMQKITKLLIQRSQQATRFTGYEILSCTVETFGKVNTKN